MAITFPLCVLVQMWNPVIDESLALLSAHEEFLLSSPNVKRHRLTFVTMDLRNHGDSWKHPLNDEGRPVEPFDDDFDGAWKDVIAVVQDLRERIQVASSGNVVPCFSFLAQLFSERRIVDSCRVSWEDVANVASVVGGYSKLMSANVPFLKFSEPLPFSSGYFRVWTFLEAKEHAHSQLKPKTKKTYRVTHTYRNTCKHSWVTLTL